MGRQRLRLAQRLGAVPKPAAGDALHWGCPELGCSPGRSMVQANPSLLGWMNQNHKTSHCCCSPTGTLSLAPGLFPPSTALEEAHGPILAFPALSFLLFSFLLFSFLELQLCPGVAVSIDFQSQP